MSDGPPPPPPALAPAEDTLRRASRLLEQLQPDAALALLERTLAAEPEPRATTAQRLALELLAARTAYLLRRLPDAAAYFRQARGTAGRLPDGALEQARICTLRGRTMGLDPSYHEELLDDLSASLEALRSANDLPALLDALAMLAHLRLARGEWEEAEGHCAELARAARVCHRPLYSAAAGTMQGLALRGRGLFARAAGALVEAETTLAGLQRPPDEGAGSTPQDEATDAETPPFAVSALRARTLLGLAQVRAEQGRRAEVLTLLRRLHAQPEPLCLDPHDQAQLRLLDALHPAGPPPMAAELARTLRQLVVESERHLPEQVDVWLEAALGLARRAAVPAEGLALVERLLGAVATVPRPELRCQTVRVQVALLLRQGEPRQAVETLRAELRQTRAAHLAAQLSVDLAQLLLPLGELAEALRLVEQALPALQQAGLELAQFQAHQLATEAFRSARLLPLAEEHLRRAEALQPRLGDELTGALLLLEQSMLQHDRGQRAAAQQGFSRLLEVAGRLKERGLLTNTLIHMANLLIDQGQRDQARALLERGRDPELLAQLPRAHVQFQMAEARLLQGRGPVAAQRVAERLHGALDLARRAQLRVEEDQIVKLLDEVAVDRV